MQSVSSQIDRITIQLDRHKNNLSKDIKLLDGLYQQNKDYFDDVNLYIAAAKRRKHEIQTNDIPKLQEHANQTGNQMDIQAVQTNDIPKLQEHANQTGNQMDIQAVGYGTIC